jgi:hypothetical protein
MGQQQPESEANGSMVRLAGTVTVAKEWALVGLVP